MKDKSASRSRCARAGLAILWVLVSAFALTGCGGGDTTGHGTGAASPPDQEKVVNVYAWADYFDPAMLERFTAETGIRVNYLPLESNDFLLTKLLAGNSGFDVVTPVDAVFGQEVQAGTFLKLDRSKIGNWRNLDPELLKRLARYDPGNDYGVPYVLGTDGIGYNETKVRAIMPDAPVDSWRLVFDPAIARRFAQCGIAMIDSGDVLWLARAYLGQDMDSRSDADLEAGEKVLMAIRPYVRMIDSGRYKGALADGEVCIAVGWSGDVQQAQASAAEAGQGVIIRYSIPREGSVLWVDMMAIPRDAPHVEEAYAFINFMQRPEVAAANTTFNRIATANAAALPAIPPSIRDNPTIFPTPDERARLFMYGTISPEYDRALNRAWTRFRTGN